IKGYIQDNEDLVKARVKEESYFFIPKFVDKKLAEKIAKGLFLYFEEIELDSSHKIRKDIDEQLSLFVEEIQNNPKWEKELQSLKSNLLSDTQLEKYAAEIWIGLKT